MGQRRVSRAAHTAFSAMHPSVPACYLVITLVLTMAAMQPVLIALSLAGGLAYGCCARGVRETLHGLRWQLPFVALVALVNPLFSASGSTELFRIGTRAVYLESLAFGCAMGGLFVAAALWFSAGARLCPFDKVMALAGNASPVVALMVSMTMRLIPRFVRRGRQIATAQTVNARALRASDALRDRLQLTTTLMDWGMDLYAPQTTLDREGRRILMAWVRMPKPSGDGWIGMFSSPRVVEIEGNHVYLRMHPAVRAAYSRKISETSQAPDGYRAVFDLKDGQQVDVGGFRIGRRNRRIYTDRSAVYPRFAGAHLISETPELAEEAHLEVLADENLIEVFINDGEHVISNAVYGLGNWLRLDPGMEIELYGLE